MSTQPLRLTVHPTFSYDPGAVDQRTAALKQNLNGWNPLNMFQLSMPSMDRIFLFLVILGVLLVFTAAATTKRR